MPTGFSWQAMSAIASSAAVIVALFGEKIRRKLFSPKLTLSEFNVVIPDQREGLTTPIRFHHYVEIINDGDPVEDAELQLLAVTFHPDKPDKERIVRVPAIAYPLGGHLSELASDGRRTIVYREIAKLGQIRGNEDKPSPTVTLEHHFNPLAAEEVHTDPHFRARYHFQVVGKNFRSRVWPVDYVKDMNIVSGWRVEVREAESEQQFWKRVRNYIREYNHQRRLDNLP